MDPNILAVVVAQAAVFNQILNTLVEAGVTTRENFHEKLKEARDTLPDIDGVADAYKDFMDLLAPYDLS